MKISIEKGFHSMVELLLRHGFPSDKQALEWAVEFKKPEIVDLLFKYGADAKSLDLVDAFYTGNPHIVKSFINNGADIFKGHPFAFGLHHSARPFLGIYKSLVKTFPQLKSQAEMALRMFCREGNEKGYCLMVWLGADPRAVVKNPHEDDAERFKFYGDATSLQEAVSNGRHEIIKRIKIAKTDNLNELLICAVQSLDFFMVQYILESGADINYVSEDNGSALSRSIGDLLFYSGDIFQNEASAAGRCFKKLIENGSKWSCLQKRDLRNLTKWLNTLDTRDVAETLQFFRDHHFCDDEILSKILNSPKMKERFIDHKSHLGRLKFLYDG